MMAVIMAAEAPALTISVTPTISQLPRKAPQTSGYVAML
jgi:hypothetical protein